MRLEREDLVYPPFERTRPGQFGPNVTIKVLDLPPVKRNVAHFGRRGPNLEVHPVYCLEEDGGSRHALLLFTTLEGHDDSENFMLDLDLVSWSETTRTVDAFNQMRDILDDDTELAVPEHAGPLIKEFLQDIPDWFKKKLIDGMAEAAKMNKLASAAVERFSKKDFAVPISYASVYGTHGAGAKEPTYFRHTIKDRKLLVADRYHVGPKIFSDSAVLFFYEVANGHVDDLFTVILRFNGEAFVTPEGRLGANACMGLLEAFIRERPEAVLEMHKRYDLMRCFLDDFIDENDLDEDEWAREYDPDRATDAEDEGAPPKERKVGRNDPCPCGSGKKYKKCCGVGKG